ncbi:hypothetical protein C2G38_2144571 [Gigaspora rosea]|uniref:Glycosyl hydrolase family 92 domain-containing protein n=1 Tax=Gigaspora rosea TaxID=44941 RepID=A0A397UT40_9GLOM|nr:hypothetical protein C2G38_2144571 [Gigaspora rosea]
MKVGFDTDDIKITGVGHYSGGWNKGSKYTVYFCSQFNKNASSFGTFWKSFINENATFLSLFDISFVTPAIGAVLGFDFDGQAFKSALEEIPNFDFEKTCELAANAWETELSKIRVNGEVGRYMPDGRSGMLNGITQDWTLVYEALLKDAKYDPCERGIFEGRMFLPYYKLLGYIPFPTYKTLSYAYVPCSKTIEYSTNDWSIALVAKSMFNRNNEYTMKDQLIIIYF